MNHAQESVARKFCKRKTPETVAEQNGSLGRNNRHADINNQQDRREPRKQTDKSGARRRLFRFLRRTGPSCPPLEYQSRQNAPRRGRLDKETFGFLLSEIFRRQRSGLRSW